MAHEPRQPKLYGNVRVGGRAHLWQGDDNRNFGNLIQIETAHFTISDVHDLPNEIFAQLCPRDSGHIYQHLLEGRESRFRCLCQREFHANRAKREKSTEPTTNDGLKKKDEKSSSEASSLRHVLGYTRSLPVHIYEQLRALVQSRALQSFQLKLPQATDSKDDQQVCNSASCASLVPVTATVVDRTILILFVGVLSTLLGRNISMQDVIHLLSKCKNDQFTSLLTFMLGLAISRCLHTRSIARLPTSHYLTFEDAYGHDRPLSMDACIHFSVLREFLKAHYQKSTSVTGEALVKAGQFHMLLGSRRGNVIHAADWSVSGRIKAGSHVVNSLYIDSEDMKCLHCQQDFVVTERGELHCTTCKVFHLDYDTLQTRFRRHTDEMRTSHLPREHSIASQPTSAPVDNEDASDKSIDHVLNQYNVEGLKNLDIRVVARLSNVKAAFDMTGQTAPPGSKLKVNIDFWEDIETFSIQISGVVVQRRKEDDFIDVSNMLNIASRSKSLLDTSLATITGLALHQVPVLTPDWFSYDRALALTNMLEITPLLYPLFVYNISELIYSEEAKLLEHPRHPKDVFHAELHRLSMNSSPTLEQDSVSVHANHSHASISDDDSYTTSEDYNSSEFGTGDGDTSRSRSVLLRRCHSCNRGETTMWRRGPDGAGTLCNACGLHYAKLTRKVRSNTAVVLN